MDEVIESSPEDLIGYPLILKKGAKVLITVNDATLAVGRIDQDASYLFQIIRLPPLLDDLLEQRLQHYIDEHTDEDEVRVLAISCALKKREREE